jgi:hypothetical protein
MSVNIYEDPKLGRQDATAAETQLANYAVLEILALLRDTESTSKKYKLTATAVEDLSAYPTGDIDPKLIVLHNKLKNLAIKRQKKNGRFLKPTTWTLYDRYALNWTYISWNQDELN